MRAAGEGGSPAAQPGVFALLLVLLLVTAYRLGARALVDPGLHFDEAQYFAWSLDPAFGYFSKPPMVAWAIAGARLVCGDGTACIRMPSVLALAVTIVAVCLLGRRLYDARTGFWAAVLLLLAPLSSLLAWFVTTDSLLLAAWAVALYGFVRALQAGALRWWLFTGAAAGVGLMSKYTMGVFAIGAAGFLLSSPAHRRLLATAGPYLGAAVAALLFAPNVAWNATHQFATVGHTVEISQVGVAPFSLQRGAVFLAEQLVVFGPLALVAFLAGLAASGRGDWRDRLLAWFAVPMLAVIAAQAFAARAHANWAATAYVAAAVLAARWLLVRPTARWLAATLAVNAAFMLVAYHYRQAVAVAGVTLPARADPLRQLQGWDGLGRAVAQTLATQGGRLLVDERRLMSLAIYYGGPGARHALTWNPQRRIDNHYRLLRDVKSAPRGPFILVSTLDRSGELVRQFASVQPLGTLDGGPCEGCERRVYAFRLGDFKGYPALD
jgi:4-amino-4-deoxy-L-arabinose transferase-like glycosyltransferase